MNVGIGRTFQRPAPKPNLTVENTTLRNWSNSTWRRVHGQRCWMQDKLVMAQTSPSWRRRTQPEAVLRVRDRRCDRVPEQEDPEGQGVSPRRRRGSQLGLSPGQRGHSTATGRMHVHTGRFQWCDLHYPAGHAAANSLQRFALRIADIDYHGPDIRAFADVDQRHLCEP